MVFEQAFWTDGLMEGREEPCRDAFLTDKSINTFVGGISILASLASLANVIQSTGDSNYLYQKSALRNNDLNHEGTPTFIDFIMGRINISQL